MKLIFIVTHGQNFTEQGFSVVYKLVSHVNMEEESWIAQRLVYNAINSADADTGIFLITKEIRQSCMKAHQRQKLGQESKKNDVQKSEKE